MKGRKKLSSPDKTCFNARSCLYFALCFFSLFVGSLLFVHVKLRPSRYRPIKLRSTAKNVRFHCIIRQCFRNRLQFSKPPASCRFTQDSGEWKQRNPFISLIQSVNWTWIEPSIWHPTHINSDAISTFPRSSLSDYVNADDNNQAQRYMNYSINCSRTKILTNWIAM